MMRFNNLISRSVRQNQRLIRGGAHDFPAPNGMNLPFNTQKKGFKYVFITFATLPAILTATGTSFILITVTLDIHVQEYMF
ncbi:hypothetical protein AX774_g3473 [Zancudomyces culisetae]|uniref:Uncharacterized protein n=1 Tax=Zancudomyces culisetae TaxID=1213189 RepID=A0A1R1PQ00_ZANCU|nr:hypothetical protein AX774_g3473 [Zancudomyces culisetae]|eukprot:OMH83028.1 hypothetical protein AX774_g3473 [Zancudomyces culisetae]